MAERLSNRGCQGCSSLDVVGNRENRREVMRVEIGEKLKAIRKEQGLTLQQLADGTGLSIGFLSNLERDLSSPTISALHKICEVLGTEMFTVLRPSSEGRIVVKKEERQEMFYSRASKVKYEELVDGDRRIRGVCLTMEPGADYGPVSRGHLKQDELLIVAKGTTEIEVGGVKYILNEGDSIYVEMGTPHKYVNIGDQDCILYCALA
jgi:transcriptional regulator with XRE-family HTH domain